MYKNNPTSEATIKETATSIVEVFEKYLLSILLLILAFLVSTTQTMQQKGFLQCLRLAKILTV